VKPGIRKVVALSGVDIGRHCGTAGHRGARHTLHSMI